MGMESVNYFFRFKEPLVKEAIEKSLKESLEVFFNKKGDIVYSGLNFWIDLQVIEKDNWVSALSIRIALSNPVNGIESSLKRLLDILFASFTHSELVDLNTKAVINRLDSEAWDQIWQSYKAKREIFEDMHGCVELPVSAELFFKYLDEKAN
jgi:hypothetical protein